MSRKEISYSSKPVLFNAAVMTGTTVLTSLIPNILYRDSIGIQLQWTGTPTGAFVIQGSLDYNPGQPQSDGAANAGTWITIPVLDINGAALAAAGSSGNILINMNQVSFPYLRVQYTNASGTGALTGYLSAKSLG